MRVSLLSKMFLLMSLSMAAFAVEGESAASSLAGTESHSSTFSPEWLSLRKDKGVKKWLFTLLEDQSAIQTDNQCNRISSINVFEGTGTCGRFNRKTSSVRELLEKSLVDQVERAMKTDSKEAAVKILVFEPDGYLQEAFILARLIQQGWTHVVFTFVTQKCDELALRGFLELQNALAQEGITIETKTVRSLSEVVVQQHPKFDVGYAVISDDRNLTFESFENVLSTTKYLSSTGSFFFSYMSGTVALSPTIGARVIEMDPAVQIACDTITSTQLKGARPKDRTIKIFTETSNPAFFVGPLLFSISELLKRGYTDIALANYFPNELAEPNRKIISRLFDSLNGPGASRVDFQWKKKIYVGDRVEFRKDLYILWFDNVNLREEVESLNREIILMGSSLPEHGHWIICGNDLGLWVVDGKKNISAVVVPQDKRQLASTMVQDIFSDGSPWYK